MIISFHIAKTGGTSISNYWHTQFGYKLFSYYTKEYNGLKASLTDKDRKTLGVPEHLKNNHRVIHGHFRYSTVNEWGLENPIYTTCLREIVPRFVSYYKRAVRRKDISPMSQDEFLLWLKNNIMSSDTYFAYLCSNLEEDVTETIDRMKTFAIVGRTENLQSYIDGLSDIFNLPKIKVPKLNIGDEKYPWDEPLKTDDILELFSKDVEILNAFPIKGNNETV